MPRQIRTTAHGEPERVEAPNSDLHNRSPPVERIPQALDERTPKTHTNTSCAEAGA